MKTCTKCGSMKPHSEFYKMARGRDGLHPNCKSCLIEASKKWQQANSERSKAYKRSYKQENADKVAAYRKQWKADNKDKVAAYATHRRAREAGAEVRLPSNYKAIVYGYYGYRCLVPGCRKTDITIDHVVPLAIGGTHEFSNLQPLCRSHNSAKSHRNSADYRNGDVMEFILVCNTCLANGEGVVKSKTVIDCEKCNVPMKEIGQVWAMDELGIAGIAETANNY